MHPIPTASQESQAVVKEGEFTFMSKLAREYFMQVDLDWMLLALSHLRAEGMGG